jgi:hypothetical protein
MALHARTGAGSRGHAIAGRVVVRGLARRHWRGRAMLKVVGRSVVLVLRRVHDRDVDLCGSR